MLLTVRPRSRGEAAAAAGSAADGEDAAVGGSRQEGTAGSPPDSLDEFAKGGLLRSAVRQAVRTHGCSAGDSSVHSPTFTIQCDTYRRDTHRRSLGTPSAELPVVCARQVWGVWRTGCS